MAGNYEVHILTIIFITGALIFPLFHYTVIVCFAGTKHYSTPVIRVRKGGEFLFSLFFVSLLAGY